MTRRRRNDPLGVLEHPNIVTDPVREAELVAEVCRKFKYLQQWYRMQVNCELNKRSYNASRDRLKKAVGKPRDVGLPERRLNAQLELEINLEARRLAGLKPHENLKSPEHQPYVDQAAFNIATRGKTKRGTPGLLALRQVVEGMMAIYLESTGKPVTAKRDHNSVYDPQLSGLGGEAIRVVVDSLEPGVSDTRLSGWIREIRQQYARKPMRFRDIFPLYGATVDRTTGMPVAIPPYRIEQFIPVMPIYCP